MYWFSPDMSNACIIISSVYLPTLTPEPPLLLSKVLLEVWLESIEAAPVQPAGVVPSRIIEPALRSSSPLSHPQSQNPPVLQQGGKPGPPNLAADGVTSASGAVAVPPEETSSKTQLVGTSHLSSSTSSPTAASGLLSEGGPMCRLRFTARDTGIGISAADLGRLFNSFTQVGV